jgi:hypothetical protein
MSIYDINFNIQTLQLTPPDKRKPVMLSFMNASDMEFQYLRDLIFDDYANGSSYLPYVPVFMYAQGTRVLYYDNAIYEASASIGIGETPANSSKWLKIIDNFLGARPRAHFNSQRMTFEYALNYWFHTTFQQPTSWDTFGNPTPISDIYIQTNQVDLTFFWAAVDEDNSSSAYFQGTEAKQFVGTGPYYINQSMFTIYVPLAVYNSLAATNPDRDLIIRAFADQYNLAGINYDIQPY